MAGIRARKLDLSGYLGGNARVASMLANADESGGIGALLTGVAGGITRAGANIREDRQRGEMRAEREKDRAFSQSLALKADARAAADQRMQEEDHKFRVEERGAAGQRTDALLSSVGTLTKAGDAKRKIAADAQTAEKLAVALARAKASAATGMPMDPAALAWITGATVSLGASGGPEAAMARAAALEEDDVEGLIGETSQLDTLASILTAQMGREKNAAKHAALGDALMQLGALSNVNKYRLRLHDANTKRRQEVAEKKAMEAVEAEAKAAADKAELDAFNADLVADGKKPVSSVEYGKMRERERMGDEKTAIIDKQRRDLAEMADKRTRDIASAVDADRNETNALRRAIFEEEKRQDAVKAQEKALVDPVAKEEFKRLKEAHAAAVARAKSFEVDFKIVDEVAWKAAIGEAARLGGEMDKRLKVSGAAGLPPSSPSPAPDVDPEDAGTLDFLRSGYPKGMDEATAKGVLRKWLEGGVDPKSPRAAAFARALRGMTGR